MNEQEMAALQGRLNAIERLLKRIMPVFISTLRKLDAKSTEFEVAKADIALLKEAVDRLDNYGGGPGRISGIAA